MAQLPPVKNFVVQDFASSTTIPDFASKLFYPLNLFLNAVYTALTNGLTLGQNTLGQITSNASITANSSGIATTTINWGFSQNPPIGVVIMSCTQSSLPVTTPLLSWSYSAGVITVTMQFVTVTSGTLKASGAGTYAMTFWSVGG